MERLRIAWILSLLAVCFGSTTYSAVRTDYEAFLSAYEDTGSSGRSISAGPVIPKDTSSAPLNVYMNMALYAIMDFDAVEGKLEIVGSISMEWTDEVKTLQGVTFTSTIDTIFFTQDQIWTPNLVLVNAADSVESIGDETYKIRYNTSSGLCKWNPRLLILAACTPDATYFPFDDQTCTLSIRPWGQETDLIVLHVTDSKWDTSDVQDSSTWALADTKSSISQNGGSYVTDFKITIKRKPLFMTIVIVLPVLLLSLLTGFLFLLPPASGERVGFGITCFLSFVVLLQTLMDLLPDSSDPMSLLCYYVILMLTLSGLLSIVNIYLLRLYMSPGKDEVPVTFIYFYKTIKCKPCKFCYRKTKEKLKPPCMTGIGKMKSFAIALFHAIRRFRCHSCRRLLTRRTVDRVRNTRFRVSQMPSTVALPGNTHGYTPRGHNAVERGHRSVPSRQLSSQTGILTERDIELEEQAPSTTTNAMGTRKHSSQTGLSEKAGVLRKHSSMSGISSSKPSDIPGVLDMEKEGDEVKGTVLEETLLENMVKNTEKELHGQNIEDHLSSQQNASSRTPVGVEITDQNHKELHEQNGEDLPGSQQSPSRRIPVDVEIIDQNQTFPLDPHLDSKKPDAHDDTGDILHPVIGTAGSNVTKRNSISEPSVSGTDCQAEVSSGYGSGSSQSGETRKRSQTKVVRLIKQADKSHKVEMRDGDDADIAVMSDVDEDDDSNDDEDELDLSSLTWEFVAQILDYFFLVTFIGLQVTFTIFFLVPLGARYNS